MYSRIILLILLPLFAFSQAPQKINFQSILRNTNGEVFANKAVSLRISILSGSINGISVYSETHTKTSDASGLISLQIGNGTVISGVFSTILWGNAAYFIKLEADFNGGSNYVFLGTQELMSVPYALYASKTDTAVLNLTNRFNSKVNISDTASMLTNYRNGLNNKLNTSDTFFMLTNYWTGLNNKVNISDTSTMLNPYLRKSDTIVSVETDPVFNTSIAKGISGIDTAYWNRKLNTADTSNMLSNYRTGLNSKVNVSDTSTMLKPYLRKSDTIVSVETDPVFNTSIAKGITGIDTAYWNRKINPSDTSRMLNPYLKKADFPLGTTTGNIQYWNGASWVNLAPGQNGQTLILIDGIPSWSGAAFPTLTTSYISAITSTSAYAEGNISSDGGASVLARGLVYGTTSNPTLSNSVLTIGSGVGGYAGTISGLTPNTTYYVRAYATNSAGTGYGNEISFQTLPVAVPTLITTDASGITQTSVTSGGTISNEGGATITERGIVYGTSTDPTTSDTKVASVSEMGSFSVNITALTPNTTYYIRAYAINSAGTGYGNEISFQTLPIAEPTLITTDALGITQTTVTSGGTISNDGGATVSESGIVYGTSSNPTTSDTKVASVSETSSFSVDITELTPNTIYYIRAYATNSAGTGYGNEITIQTLPVVVPTLITTDASGITQTSVTSGGTIINDGGATVSESGIVYGTSSNPTTSDTKVASVSETSSFSVDITELTPNTTYYIRAYATNSTGTGYGNEITIQTLPVVVPTLITTDASGITQTSVTSGGTISNDGGATVSERGIVYGTSSNPTTSDTKITSVSETSSFSVDITELTPNTIYYIRAYAANSAGTGYGNEIIFQTLPVTSFPTLTTYELTNITNTTATGGGSITNDGGSNITVKGNCWSTSPNPTISDSKTTDGSGTSTFTSFMTGLSASVTYYVRAYATNSTGTGYGNQKTFTTNSTSNTLPVVTSNSVTGLTTVQATFNAEVNSQGGGTVTERGAVWNTSGNPTVNSNRVPSGSGIGVYSATITGLSGGSNYYVRAYALNNYGISYGVEISFTTLIGLATLTTNNVITQSTTASSGGNISDNGGSNVTARGVVWNTTGMPTISDSKTTDGSGTGSFVSIMSSLSTSTTYYVRAYATNSTGTAYGNQQTSTSQPVKDIDGNTYNTVQIGNQVWMSENLKTSRYRNGGSIPYVLSNSAWRTLTSGAWSYYNHDGSNNAIYGKLYNWYSTLGDTLCPVGWHVPSDSEWTTLTDYLGGENVAGGKMKSIGIANWYNPNTGASNESVFSALPGGCRDSYGSFVYITTNAYFWSTNEGNNNYALNRVLSSGDSIVTRGNIYIGFSGIKSVGASVRCLKD